MCSEGEQNDFVSPTLIRSGDFLTNKGKIGFFRRGIVYKRDFHGITFLEWSNFPELLPFPSKLEKFFHCPQYFLPIINQILMRQKDVEKLNPCDTHSMVNVWYAWNDRILNSKLFLDIRVTDRQKIRSWLPRTNFSLSSWPTSTTSPRTLQTKSENP